jgi:CRAL/TRIO domain
VPGPNVRKDPTDVGPRVSGQVRLIFVELLNHKRTIHRRLVVPMPKTASPDAPRVVVVRNGIHNPNIVSFGDFLAMGLINTDILLTDDDNVSVAGQILIFDLKGVTMSHIAGTGPLELKRMIFLNQEAVPVRQKFIHFLNAPSSFFAVYNLGKSLVCDKIRKRVSVRSTNY